MSKGRYEHKGCHRRRKFSSKSLVLVLACVLLIGGVIGGTVAWLTAKTNEVTNVFTTSDINITLTESEDLDLQMIPGHTITKDPTVTVLAGSEKCWLFVTLEKSENFDTFMTYEMEDGWTELETGVYYREVAASDDDQSFHVIKDDKVTVSETVTKADMNGLTADNYPTLTITAYATQYNKNNTETFSAAEAWAVLNPPTP